MKNLAQAQRQDPLNRFQSHWLKLVALPTAPIDLLFDCFTMITASALVVSALRIAYPVITQWKAGLIEGALGVLAMLVLGVSIHLWRELPEARYCMVYRVVILIIGLGLGL